MTVKPLLSKFVIPVLMLLTTTASAQAAEKLIVVSSFSEKSADPNMVSLNVEVWSKAATAKQAQSANANEMQKVRKSLESFKIKKEDIQTESYSLNPDYVYDSKTQQNRLSGFRAMQILRVTLHKTEELGGFLDAVVSSDKGTSGVSVNNISWDTDQRSHLEISALGDAVKNGRLKADELAKAAGVKIKGVSVISHGSSGSAPIPFRASIKSMASDAMAEGAATQVSPGQIKVRVDVTTEYEI